MCSQRHYLQVILKLNFVFIEDISRNENILMDKQASDHFKCNLFIHYFQKLFCMYLSEFAVNHTNDDNNTKNLQDLTLHNTKVNCGYHGTLTKMK